MTALSYQLFILDLTYFTRKARFVEDAEETRQMKMDSYWKVFVTILIILSAIIFTVDYVVEMKEDVVNQLYRPLIIGWYTLVGTIFIFLAKRVLK